MENQHKHNHFSPKTILTVAAGILVAGSATAWWVNKSFFSSNGIENTPITTEIKPNIPNNSQNIAKTQNIKVYWLDDNLELLPTSVSIPQLNNPQESLEKALNILLTNTTEENNDTTIPEGTKLLSLKVDEKGIDVNLSSKFTSGGGSASMIGRLGQLVYTATTLDPSAEVWIYIDGEPLELLGGEGLEVRQPMTREIFQEDFSL
jgi:spore germination protein GerM